MTWFPDYQVFIETIKESSRSIWLSIILRGKYGCKRTSLKLRDSHLHENDIMIQVEIIIPNKKRFLTSIIVSLSNKNSKRDLLILLVATSSFD